MNDTLIVTIFVLIDAVMQTLDPHSHPQAGASDSAVLTVAVVAACQCQNHHERTLCMMRALHYLSGDLSTSRFNRRIHALAAWLPLLLDLVGEGFAIGEAFIVDSMPLPVCRRARAGRCRKVRGAVYCGYCAAKEERAPSYIGEGSRRMVRTRAPMQHRLRPRECPPSAGARQV